MIGHGAWRHPPRKDRRGLVPAVARLAGALIAVGALILIKG